MSFNFSNKKGFTLVELMVSVFIFSLIVGGVVNALVAGISFQRRIIAEQRMFSEMSFVLEYMSRTLRMARKDIAGTCISRNHNYATTTTPAPNTLRFLNFDGDCQDFSFATGVISKRIATSSSSADLPAIAIPLTSGNVIITNLAWDRGGSTWHSPATNQSRVAIVLTMRANITGSATTTIQTVVSQRQLNVPY